MADEPVSSAPLIHRLGQQRRQPMRIEPPPLPRPSQPPPLPPIETLPPAGEGRSASVAPTSENAPSTDIFEPSFLQSSLPPQPFVPPATPAASGATAPAPPGVLSYQTKEQSQDAPAHHTALEQVIGLKLAGWVGAIVLVIGAGLGIKFAYDQGW